MDDKNECTSMIVSNLALVQCQGIVVGFVASMVAVVMDLFSAGAFDLDHALLLCASAIVTASIASFALGLVMVGVILVSRKCKVNPDNVATPIAGNMPMISFIFLRLQNLIQPSLHCTRRIIRMILAFIRTKI